MTAYSFGYYVRCAPLRPVEYLACFAGELNQVIMNVIAHAIDSIEGRGKITLRNSEKALLHFRSLHGRRHS
jgi:signal transduction histidine kinase